MQYDSKPGDSKPGLPKKAASKAALPARIRDLEARLNDAEEALRAFRNGEVDAIVAPGPDGDRVYTLEGADEAYRVMVQEMAEGAVTLTPAGLILFSNQQFAAMLRFPLERVIGSRFQDFVASGDGHADAGIVSRLLEGTGGGKAEIRMSSDGTTFVPVYLSVRSVVLAGAACQFLIVTDLSAQKRYEELVAVMEAVPVGVFIAHDAECRKVVGNRMAYELLRTPAGANISASPHGDETPRGWREVANNGEDIPAGELPMQVAARSGQPVHDCEFSIQFDDGTSRIWSGNAVPLFDELMHPRGAVGAFVDITDRKRAEETLAAANTELRNFVYALAHGLHEPLRKVLDFTRLLVKENEGKLGEEADRYLSGSVEGALRMEALLGDLLRYWEVTERSEGLSPVDCGQVLSQALLNLQGQIQKSGAIVTVEPMPTVVADEVMLLQIFQNLIANSVRYRGRGLPEIHVSAVRAGERWMFSVQDNGIGVDRADAARVFDMFGRPDGKGARGTGVGLALCRKAVERHGGRIWVESEPGHGANFRFTIPIYLDSALPGFSTPGLALELV